MTPENLARVERLVGPVAWAYYDGQEPLDLDGLMLDLGDVRLVAAEVLAYVCELSRRASVTAGAVRSVRIGSISIERTAGVSAASVDADLWCARAQALRLEVRRMRGGTVSLPVVAG